MWFTSKVKKLIGNAKNPPDKAGDVGLIPAWGRSPGRGNGNPLQYSCLGNPMDRGAWWATTDRVTKSRTRLKLLSTLHAQLVTAGLPESRGGFREKPKPKRRVVALSFLTNTHQIRVISSRGCPNVSLTPVTQRVRKAVSPSLLPCKAMVFFKVRTEEKLWTQAVKGKELVVKREAKCLVLQSWKFLGTLLPTSPF